ncbi:hypothetical protein A6R68_09782, partial [Neotoma lepida]
LYTVKQGLTSQPSEEIDQNQKGCPSEVVSNSDNTIGDLPYSKLLLKKMTGHSKPKNEVLLFVQTHWGVILIQVESTDDILPRTVSSHHHLKKDFSNVSCSTALRIVKPVIGWDSLWKLEEVGIETQP